MRVLLWHGYLLSGSGSNVYTANLAERWRTAGHDVLLMCQERNIDAFGFIDEHGGLRSGEASWTMTGAAEATGRCRLLRPDIGGLLPVYVYDEYEGFEVKTFVDLDESELASYTDKNVAALEWAIAEHRPDAIITGHEVMGPAIARRACEPIGASYLAKLHGSGLEFAVKRQDRYRDYAIEGLNGARVVVGGSRYMIEAASSIVPGWRDRAVVVNPGCDTDLFRPAPARADGVLRVVYVGKLIAAKGVHHLVAAAGLIHAIDRIVIVGYGGFESGLRELASALQAGDKERALVIASAGEDGRPLSHLRAFLEGMEPENPYWERLASIDIEFTGRLDHGPLAGLLPSFDVLVAPSVIPEAFGLVVAEAASCGLLPVAPAHSGIGEAAQTLEAELGASGLLTFSPDDPIRGIAASVERIDSLGPEERRRLGAAGATFAHERWSWTQVAESLLRLAAR